MIVGHAGLKDPIPSGGAECSAGVAGTGVGGYAGVRELIFCAVDERCDGACAAVTIGRIPEGEAIAGRNDRRGDGRVARGEKLNKSDIGGEEAPVSVQRATAALVAAAGLLVSVLTKSPPLYQAVLALMAELSSMTRTPAYQVRPSK